MSDSAELHLLDGAADGDDGVVAELLDLHRQRLLKLVEIRMDARLRARIDPADVVQETLSEAYRRLADYLAHRPISFYPWLRQIALNRLIDMYRRHVEANGRSVNRERASAEDPELSSARFVSDTTSPSEHLARQERVEFVRTVLGQLSDADRDIVVMRHIEQLSTREIAGILCISENAAKTRLVRALKRFRDIAVSSSGSTL